MAEAHGFTGHAYGDAGILTYRLANEHSENHIGNLESSRYTERGENLLARPFFLRWSSNIQARA